MKRKTSSKSKLQPLYVNKLTKHEPSDDIPGIIQDFLLVYPEELQDAFNRFNKTRQHPQTDSGLTLIEFILRELKNYAEKILKESNFPIDLGELLWIDGETQMDIKNASAKQTLFSINELLRLVNGCRECKAMIDANQIELWNQCYEANINLIEEVITETIRLMAASIKLGAYHFIKFGFETERGRRSSHQPKKPLGVLNAINSILEENPKLSAKRIWLKLSKYKKDSPYIHEPFEVFFKEQKLYQKNNSKRGIEIPLAFDSFRRHVTEAKKNIQSPKKLSQTKKPKNS